MRLMVLLLNAIILVHLLALLSVMSSAQVYCVRVLYVAADRLCLDHLTQGIFSPILTRLAKVSRP